MKIIPYHPSGWGIKYTKSLYYCGTQLRLRQTKKSDMPWVWASSGTDSEHEGLTAPGSESVYVANMLKLHLNHPMSNSDFQATGEAGAQSETRSTAAIAPPTYAWRKTRARAAHCAAPTAWPKYATERSTERTLRSVVTVATTMVPLSRRRR